MATIPVQGDGAVVTNNLMGPCIDMRDLTNDLSFVY